MLMGKIASFCCHFEIMKVEIVTVEFQKAKSLSFADILLIGEIILFY